MPLPSNNFGQIYNNGVKYIKISRFDSGGLDRTGYLDQLQTLRIAYDTIGVIEYNIISAQEQTGYYIYGISPVVQPTSSIDYNILDHNLEVIKNSSFKVSIGQESSPNNYDVEVNNPLNYFNLPSGIYTFEDTPNVPITASFTASAKLVTPGFLNTDSGVKLIISGPNYITYSDLYDLTGFNSSVYTVISGSTILYPRPSTSQLIEGTSVYLRFDNVLDSTANLLVKDLTLTFYQSAPTNTSTSLTIFNPDFVDFFYNDYNPLFGNAEVANTSTKYMDVDYTTNYTSPVNFNLIISGTANKAQVQDSNYNSSAWSNIRYNGVRSTSPDFNQLTTNGGYGTSPNVEQNKTYIAYFDGVGGTGPEIIGQTAYLIKWLIDEKGDVVNPEPGTTALYNLIDSFEPEKNALVRLTSTDPLASSNPNDNALTGLHPITHVGRIATMLVTQTGSGQMDYLRTMSFNYVDGNPIAQATANVSSWWYTNVTSNISNTNWDTMNFNTVGYQNGWGNPSPGVYKMVQSGGTLGANTRIKFQIRFYLVKPPNSNNISNTFAARLIKNGNVFQTFSFTSIEADTNDEVSQNYYRESDWIDVNELDEFQVQYQVGTGGTGAQIQIWGTGNGAYTELRIVQENPLTTGFINTITGATASYWSVGDYLTGSYVSVLTASQALNNLHSIGVYQSSPHESLAFGFSSCSIAFSPQRGDYIRFQYDKNRVHNITNVSTISVSGSNQSSSLFLTVVPPIATSSILDNFVLYRIINDGTYVVLDVEKPVAGNSFGGIIQPQYVSQTIVSNYDNIIQNLTQKNLIP